MALEVCGYRAGDWQFWPILLVALGWYATKPSAAAILKVRKAIESMNRSNP